MKRQAIVFLILLLAAGLAAAQTVTSAFSYQGRLTVLDAPADGAFDIEFRLYDAVAGGGQVGGTLLADDLAVEDGLFAVVLDFGPGVITGGRLWLELAVREGASTGAFTVLAPRQELTATPHAAWTLAAADADRLDGLDSDDFATDAELTVLEADVAAIDARVTVLEATNEVVVAHIEGCAIPPPPYPQDCDDPSVEPLPAYPFVVDLSGLGSVTADQVVVAASGHKYGYITYQVPLGSLQISWIVLDAPLRAELSLWDPAGNEYDVNDTTNWRDNQITMSVVASVE